MENEEFYNYQLQFQTRQSEMEQQRCRLEKEMFSIMKSDKNLHSLQTNKLRSHWKAVCERQKVAQKRNESILRDFEEFEQNIQEIELKTKQLQSKKKIYEDRVKELYPQWREKVDLAFARKQLQSYNETVQKSPPHNFAVTSASSNVATPHTKLQTEVKHQSTPMHSAKPEETLTSPTKSEQSQEVDSLEASLELPPPDSFAEKINVSITKTKPKPATSVTGGGNNILTSEVLEHRLVQDDQEDESDDFDESISVDLKELDDIPVKNSKMGSYNKSNSSEHVSPVKADTTPSPVAKTQQALLVPPATKTTVQSFFSESESTSEVSPRTNAPLTTMSAYQAMLKNSERIVPPEDDSNDNLEDILSPRNDNRYEVESPDEDEHDLSEDASDISEINAHNQYHPTMMASLKEKEKIEKDENKKTKVSENNKMPWDLDSDSDESLGPNSLHGNTTGSSWKPQNTMEQDDFDFYD